MNPGGVRMAPGVDMITVDEAPPLAFPQNWEERQARYGEGMTLPYADQRRCFASAMHEASEVADEVGIETRRGGELKGARELQDLAPCPHGTFAMVCDRALATCTPTGFKRPNTSLQEALGGGAR